MQVPCCRSRRETTTEYATFRRVSSVTRDGFFDFRPQKSLWTPRSIAGRPKRLFMVSASSGGVDPNDPMTWRAKSEAAPIEKSRSTEEPPKFLTPDEMNQLLATQTGTLPQGPEDMDVVAAAFELPSIESTPLNAAEAIAQGLELTGKRKYAEALEMFELGLGLPGSGVKRNRNKPGELSQGEEVSIWYNIACCHSQLQDSRAGLMAFKGALEAGFEDFRTARVDPDLDFLRKQPQFEGLIQRFKPNKGLLGNIMDMLR